jgi:hypothetical protein
MLDIRQLYKISYILDIYWNFTMKPLDFDDSVRIQSGLAWKESMKCVTCGYQSPLRNIYETVQANRRGPKTAALNYAAQVGLSHTSIASTGLSNILLAMDIPSLSLSGMQKCANKVGDMLVEHNTENMRGIRKELQELNTVKGLPASAPVNVEMDCRYNNPIYSAVGNSPFQAATQVSHITVENATRKKYIVDVQTHSKLCQQGEWIARTTGHRPCPEHPGCTADPPQSAVIGNEKSQTKRINKRKTLFRLHETCNQDSSAFYKKKSCFETDCTQ